MPVVARRTTKTQRGYDRAIVLFRQAAGDKPIYTHDDVARAAEALEKKYKPSTVDFVLRVCRSRVPGWPADTTYRYDATSVDRPKLTHDEVVQIIRFAKTTACDRDAAIYTFISTTYGLRCNELAAITPEDFDLNEGTFFARTSKHGTQRKHLLPRRLFSQNASLARAVRSVYVVSEQTMAAIYRHVETSAGIPHRRGYGWHAIRRALATGLADAGVDRLQGQKFLRWRDSGMYEHYAMLDYTADRKIFDLHPFLKFWSIEGDDE